ncbi:RDD family protein [Actinoplanes bogorensis]|uniref:RDD family protein n=1 Tax=Paractinoplanes bogorensis TaxID=1610840 RepID=A0ABS5Z426_9ACTN|nr:RDD family protein [Actinoplanes bogorensis]MBU2670397.1 RDD family protein [Actinoplanes bogorensis]
MSDPTNMRSGQWTGYQYPPANAELQPYSPAAYPLPTPTIATAERPLVSVGGRFGALLLDSLLMLVTLWIGWIIWSMITWSDGQTPAKKLLGHVVADQQTGRPLDWGQMAMREFCIKGLLGSVLNLVSAGVYFWVDSFMVFGERQRTLHDRMANSIVRHI